MGAVWFKNWCVIYQVSTHCCVYGHGPMCIRATSGQSRSRFRHELGRRTVRYCALATSPENPGFCFTNVQGAGLQHCFLHTSSPEHRRGELLRFTDDSAAAGLRE